MNANYMRSSDHGAWSMETGLESWFGENLTFGAWATEVIGTRIEWVKVRDEVLPKDVLDSSVDTFMTSR